MFLTQPKIKYGLAALAVFIAGFGAGFWLDDKFFSDQTSFYKIHPAGSQSFKFINPLLGFEVAESQDSFIELVPLRRRLSDFINELGRRGVKVSVYYRNMENGHWIGINEDEGYDPASLYKVPFMIAYLKAAEDKPSLLTKRITFTATDAEAEKSKESAQVVDLTVGESYSAEELLGKMIIDSDNTAKSLLVKNVDLNYIGSVFNDLGVPLFTDEYYKISAQRYSLFFRTLYNATFLNRAMSEKAMELLSRAYFKFGLQGGFPENMPLAHKFGDHAIYENGKITAFELHDCGVVYFPKRPSFICVMTRGPDLQTLSQVIQKIANIAYEERDK